MMTKTFVLLALVAGVSLLSGRPGQAGYSILSERSLDLVSGGDPLTWPQPGNCSYLSLGSGEVSELQCNGANGSVCVHCEGGSYTSVGLGNEDTPHVQDSGGNKACENNFKYKGTCVNNLCDRPIRNGNCAGEPDTYMSE